MKMFPRFTANDTNAFHQFYEEANNGDIFFYDGVPRVVTPRGSAVYVFGRECTALDRRVRVESYLPDAFPFECTTGELAYVRDQILDELFDNDSCPYLRVYLEKLASEMDQ